jgi:hypothetical protein
MTFDNSAMLIAVAPDIFCHIFRLFVESREAFFVNRMQY